MQGRKPGSIVRFVCNECGETEATTGGSFYYICSNCKPADHYTNGAQYKAHKAVADARRRGELKDPGELDCVDCGGPAIEYDHRDYSKPLEVVPVCRRCNLRRGPAIGSPAYGKKRKPSTESA